MSSTPWFKFYPGDYKSDTGRLTTVQHGAYILLLLDYYATGEAPPDDDIVLAKITLCDSQNEWFAIRKAIARHFEITDVWRHERCEKELIARSAEHTKKSEAGKKGNEIKWGVSQSDTQKPSSAIRKSIAIPEVRSQKSEVRGQNLEVRDQNSEPEESKSKDLRGSRLNIPQIVDEWINWAITERPELTVSRVHMIYEQFSDHWKSQPGSKGIKLDWFATWRNWVRREKSFNRTERLSIADQTRVVVEEFKLKLRQEEQQTQGEIYEHE